MVSAFDAVAVRAPAPAAFCSFSFPLTWLFWCGHQVQYGQPPSANQYTCFVTAVTHTQITCRTDSGTGASGDSESLRPPRSSLGLACCLPARLAALSMSLLPVYTLRAGSALVFRVSTGIGGTGGTSAIQSAVGTDMFSYPTAPVVSSVSGCTQQG